MNTHTHSLPDIFPYTRTQVPQPVVSLQDHRRAPQPRPDRVLRPGARVRERVAGQKVPPSVEGLVQGPPLEARGGWRMAAQAKGTGGEPAAADAETGEGDAAGQGKAAETLIRRQAQWNLRIRRRSRRVRSEVGVQLCARVALSRGLFGGALRTRSCCTHSITVYHNSD